MYQSRLFGAVLVAVGMLTACESKKANDDKWSPPSLEDEINSSFVKATGTWDWARGDSTCLGNTHTISFSADRKLMTLKNNAPRDTTLKARETTYNVLSAGPGRFLDFRHVVRGAIVGETRRTSTDDLAVWDLVVVTPNRYHWHRTDWPDDGMTPAVVRCDGTHPLEQWTPPPGPPVGPTAR